MSNTPIQDAVRAYALSHVGAAYVMGATAQKCTPGMRRSLANGRSAEYADAITANCPVLSGKKSTCDGCKYSGRLAFDCAQLSRFSARAGGIELPSGSNSQWTKVAWAKRGEIADMPTDVVCFVYHYKSDTGKMSHVGVYLGDGMVVDARGHANGVLHSQVTSYPWTHYAIPAEIAAEAQLDAVIHPTYGKTCRRTLRKGSKGEDVVYLQQLLTAEGALISVDGIFGGDTLLAVKDFQASHGLTVDGVVGPLTWAALEDDASAVEDGRTESSLPDIAAWVAGIDQALEGVKAAVHALADVLSGGAPVEGWR